MKTGISLYPGLGGSKEKKIALLKEAASLGIRRLFTSLHIPETDKTTFATELKELLKTAGALHFDVIADVSPKTCQLLGLTRLDIGTLSALGITTLRFDEGFSPERIALFSHLAKVQVNASTLGQKEIDELKKNKADFSQLEALHNFYPRPHTGLDETYFTAQTRFLQAEGLSVGAFIPSQCGRRAPLQEGLPSLEMHRDKPVSLTARHLAALGLQSVFIGDDAPSFEELTALARSGREETGVVALKAKLLCRKPAIQDFLSLTFTARRDPARDVIRAADSRTRLNGLQIEATGPFVPLHCGDITLDNAAFLRYMGEVQIVKRDLPVEKRTNLVAQILPEERFLLAYITPGRKFRFDFVR